MRIIWRSIFLIKISTTQCPQLEVAASPFDWNEIEEDEKVEEEEEEEDREKSKTVAKRRWKHRPRLGRFSVPPAAPAPKARPTGVRSVLFQSSSRTRRRATPRRKHTTRLFTSSSCRRHATTPGAQR